MVVALFNGMAHHEASVVVPAYYISLTVMTSLQGLCVFQLLAEMTPLSAAGFSIGVLLCTLAVGWSSWKRREQQGERAHGNGIDQSQLLANSPLDRSV